MAVKTVKEILTRARTLLDEGGWVQLSYQRLKPGYQGTEPPALTDYCYCSVGAVFAAASNGRLVSSPPFQLRSPCFNALKAVADCAVPDAEPPTYIDGYDGVVMSWNDNHALDKAQVLKAFDCAIARETEREAVGVQDALNATL